MTPLQWSHNNFLEFWNKRLLNMLDKTDFFLHLWGMQFPFLLGKLNRYLINLFAYCKNEWSWNHFYAAGFPDFRSTWHAKHSGKHLLINSISSIFSVSINIRVLVLRTVFRVARLSADQRAFQKKDEYRFSIFYKEQLHKEELTGQSKWGWGCMGNWIAVLWSHLT